MFFRNIVISIFAFLIFTGCAIKPGHVPDQEVMNKTYQQLPVAVDYSVEAYANGAPNIQIEPLLERTIKKVFEEKNLVASLHSDSDLSDYKIAFVLNSERNDFLAFLSGFISGYTLTIIPGYAKDSFELKATLYQKENLLNEYTYQNSVSTYIWLPLVFTGIDKPEEVYTDTIKSMVKELVYDLDKDQLLSPVTPAVISQEIPEVPQKTES